MKDNLPKNTAGSGRGSGASAFSATPKPKARTSSLPKDYKSTEQAASQKAKEWEATKSKTISPKKQPTTQTDPNKHSDWYTDKT